MNIEERVYGIRRVRSAEKKATKYGWKVERIPNGNERYGMYARTDAIITRPATPDEIVKSEKQQKERERLFGIMKTMGGTALELIKHTYGPKERVKYDIYRTIVGEEPPRSANPAAAGVEIGVALKSLLTMDIAQNDIQKIKDLMAEGYTLEIIDPRAFLREQAANLLKRTDSLLFGFITETH